ncbi:hypothetical protein P3W33_09600 [Luteibacter sp. PPL552]
MRGLKTLGAVFALALSTSSQAAALDGLFIQGQAGVSHASSDYGPRDGRSDTARAVVLGYRWSLSENYALGVETGYSRLGNFGSSTLGSAALASSGTPQAIPQGYSWKLRTRAMVLGASMKWSLSGPWTLMAHAGGVRSHATVDEAYVFMFVNRSRHLTTDHNGVYAGASFGYDITPQLTAALIADVYRVKFENGFVAGMHTNYVRVLGGSLEYRF